MRASGLLTASSRGKGLSFGWRRGPAGRVAAADEVPAPSWTLVGLGQLDPSPHRIHRNLELPGDPGPASARQGQLHDLLPELHGACLDMSSAHRRGFPETAPLECRTPRHDAPLKCSRKRRHFRAPGDRRRSAGECGAGDSGRGGPGSGPGRSRDSAPQRGVRGRKPSGGGRHPAHRTAGPGHAPRGEAGGPAGRLPGSTVRRGFAHCRGDPGGLRAREGGFRGSADAATALSTPREAGHADAGQALHFRRRPQTWIPAIKNSGP